MLKEISKENAVYRSFIGQGYYGTVTPKVILRNVFENPGWYTSYTPYQAEISQGRLEALINFQTMVGDLTGFEIANASLLDEVTAAAESMTLAHRVGKSKSQRFFIDQNCFPQTISVVTARAKPIGIEVMVGDPKQLTDLKEETYFGALLQYPGNDGAVVDFSQEIVSMHAQNGLVIMATDLLALTLLKSPGEMGADIVKTCVERHHLNEKDVFCFLNNLLVCFFFWCNGFSLNALPLNVLSLKFSRSARSR